MLGSRSYRKPDRTIQPPTCCMSADWQPSGPEPELAVMATSAEACAGDIISVAEVPTCIWEFAGPSNMKAWLQEIPNLG